jgi:hypothetical protein
MKGTAKLCMEPVANYMTERIQENFSYSTFPGQELNLSCNKSVQVMYDMSGPVWTG